MQHASVFEPLQYQLTQFIHEGESLWHQTNHDIEQLIVDIRLFKYNEINENILDLLEEKISAIKDHLLEYLECINKALSIVWHTNRTDLIDKLSALNETFHHLLQDSLGHSSTLDILSTGLYATLEASLCDIYDNSFLTDKDAAIEGLTRLNIWYLEDYWKIGILPMIEKMEDLNLDPDKFDETSCLEHHQKLFSLVQQQLKRLHIETVSDLKKAHIYSKSLFLKYIERRKNLLLKSLSKSSK